jgi:DNA-binding XRE family transcriptional regulator
VSRQTINAIEKEKFDPGIPVAFRICSIKVLAAPNGGAAVGR